MKNKYLIVEIHDTTPEFKSELIDIVSNLDNLGIARRSVLVIPNYYEKNNLINDKGFISWLDDLKEKGNEIVQHGYNHVSTNYNYKSRWDKFVGTKLTHGGGEFQNISYDEAQEKIQKGKDILEKIGFSSKGFVPPAWLLNPESERAIKEQGFSYYTTFRHINFPSQGRREKAEAIVFTSGKGFVNKLFALYNHDLVHRVFKKRRIARVAIHPKDLHSRLFENILNSIEKVRQGREIVTSADLALNIKNLEDFCGFRIENSDNSQKHKVSEA